MCHSRTYPSSSPAPAAPGAPAATGSGLPQVREGHLEGLSLPQGGLHGPQLHLTHPGNTTRPTCHSRATFAFPLITAGSSCARCSQPSGHPGSPEQPIERSGSVLRDCPLPAAVHRSCGPKQSCHAMSTRCSRSSAASTSAECYSRHVSNDPPVAPHRLQWSAPDQTSPLMPLAARPAAGQTCLNPDGSRGPVVPGATSSPEWPRVSPAGGPEGDGGVGSAGTGSAPPWSSRNGG